MALKWKPLENAANFDWTPSLMKNTKQTLLLSTKNVKNVIQIKLRKVHYVNISTVQEKLKIQKEDAHGLTIEQITRKFFMMGSLEKGN